jgi:glycosyltransferase involved in cell wall biosynthesis
MFLKDYFLLVIMKKICFFFGHYGPSLHVIMNYYERIFPKDIELFLVCANKIDREKYQFKRTKVFEFLDKQSIVPFRLRKFLKEKNINLLTNIGGEGKIAVTLFIATIFTKTKVMFYSLGDPRINLENSFFLFSQFFTNRFLSCCKEDSDKFKRFLVFKRKETFYLPFPININLFKPKNKGKLRKKLGFNEKDKIIFYVGRIEVEQGSDYLLQLIQKNPNKKFLLIGEIRDENFKNRKFKNLIHIPFIPNSELSDYYNVADISLFFSKRNSYPYPPRESLACGIPVMVFNLKTFGQLNTPAAKKLPFDIEKVQEEIEKFFLLPEEERKRLSKEGVKFVIGDSSEEKVKGATVNYFLELLK